ncbi:MAG: hypothetical protein DDT38_01639 [Firmicutes bacterium]|nr:hypothetical protein [candidate division NPL-UPA2 bacterium]
MKIRLKTSIASSEWSYALGELVDVGEAAAAAWIEAGIAESAEAAAGPDVYETATLVPAKHKQRKEGQL